MWLINRQKIKQFMLSGHFLTPENYLRRMGVKVGKGCHIRACKVNALEGYLIEIGNSVRISQNVDFFTHGGVYGLRVKFADPDFDFFGKIKIGDRTFIGEGAKIMAGCHIGCDVIVGAGSVVTHSIPNGVVVGGNPARYICTTEEFYNKMRRYNLESGGMDAKSKRELLLSLPDEKFMVKPLLKIVKGL